MTGTMFMRASLAQGTAFRAGIERI